MTNLTFGGMVISFIFGAGWFLMWLHGPIHALGRFGSSILFSLLGVASTLGGLPSIIQSYPGGPWNNLFFVIPVLAGFGSLFLVVGWLLFEPDRWRKDQ